MTVLTRTLEAFASREDVGMVMVAVRPEVEITRPKQNPLKINLAIGGATRAESVRAALRKIPDSYEWVAVHDAARPLISRDLIDRTIAAAFEHGAAVPALRVHLTIKQASAPLPAKVERTLPRQTLWAMQTPQVMRREDLIEAFERCPIPRDEVTDDAQLLELAGKDVWLVPGDERNIKITTAVDLKLAEMLLE